MKPRLLLLKPPEAAAFSFGAFSLGVLAGAVRDQADVRIVDATRRDPGAVVRDAVTQAPDHLGITVMGPGSVPPVAHLIERLRAAFRGRDRPVILAGGHGATMIPGLLLRAGADAVVVGEGERTLAEILDGGVRPGMAGVAQLLGGEVVTGPPRAPIQPLDALPLPARDLMPPAEDHVHLLETSRGCPHACTFCEATRFHGRRWRALSPERVARDVARLVEEAGAWIVEIADDSFAANPRRALRICELLREGPLPALVFVSARADDLAADPGLIPAMASARMLRVSVGIETLEPATAASAGKAIPAAAYRRVFAALRERGIFSIASVIVGLPGETPLTRSAAVEAVVEAGPDAARFLPFLPRPASPASATVEDYQPCASDVRDAAAFTDAFHRHPTTQARLGEAVRAGGVRGVLAGGTLRSHGRGGAPRS